MNAYIIFILAIVLLFVNSKEEVNRGTLDFNNRVLTSKCNN